MYNLYVKSTHPFYTKDLSPDDWIVVETISVFFLLDVSCDTS